jgi:lipopolysaccharide export system permease protein
MRLLDRYLLRELLIPLGYCLGGFLIFWVSFDLMAELRNFQEEGLGAAEIGWYYLYKTPELLVVVVPMALLLAILYALTNHARHNELTAIRAAGVSLARLCLPYMGVGLVLSLGLLAVNELLVPKTTEAAKQFLKGSGRSDLEEGAWHHHLNFRNARDGRIWNIGAFNTVTFEMRHPQVEWELPGRSMRLIARSAVRSDNGWVFLHVHEIVTLQERPEDSPAPCHFPRLEIPEFTETPEQIKSEIKMSQVTGFRSFRDVHFSVREILDYLRLHPDLNRRDRALLHTKLHERLATPWTCVVVVLIAIPFGASSGRRNVFAGVASSIMICFCYFVLLRLGLALGTGGYVPAWFAGWGPNLIFAAGGVWLSLRGR